jgi:hypothetical protein
MASIHRPRVGLTAAVSQHLASLARHVVFAVAVDCVAAAAHADAVVRIALAVVCLAGHRVWCWCRR